MNLREDNKKKVSSATDKGFENLLGVHLEALEDNSKSVVEILELLANKKLPPRYKNSLKKIKSELKGIDKKIDSLGRTPKTEESEDWFEF